MKDNDEKPQKSLSHRICDFVIMLGGIVMLGAIAMYIVPIQGSSSDPVELAKGIQVILYVLLTGVSMIIAGTVVKIIFSFNTKNI